VSYLEPALPLLIFLALIGLANAWRRSAKGRRPWLLTISIGGILLLSLPAVAWVLSRPLESWYQDNPLPRESADAIVILAGTVRSATPGQPYTFAAPDTYERLQHGVWLFKNWKAVPILVCGGSFDDKEPYSATMSHVLESEGVPRSLIWIEKHSRSTHENALNAAKILREHGVSRIALVVEANSMPRAAASFRKAGIIVVPAPARFTRLHYEFTDVFPDWRAMALNGETIHEFLGLAWYRLRGWI
jgi:uncharacterized SAM-binding protein YcdF (DUF218 family)